MKQQRVFLKALLFFVATFLVVEATGFYLAFRRAPQDETDAVKEKPKSERPDDLKARNTMLRASFGSLHPRGIYILIDTGRSTLSLRDRDRVISQAVASSESGSILVEPNGKRR